MSEINTSDLYIVEGVVESDPLSGHCTVRTAVNGQPFSFDPQAALKHFAGREVRVVVVPLATVSQLEEAYQQASAQGEAVEVVDPPSKGN